jgi:hypothetical protein
MPEFPPAPLGSGRTDDPVQSHDQILQLDTGKMANALLSGRLCPIRVSTYQGALRTK